MQEFSSTPMIEGSMVVGYEHLWGWGDEGSFSSGVMPHQGAAEQTAWWGMFQAGCSENLRLEREREREML